MFEAFARWQSEYNLTRGDLPEGTTRENLDCVTVHKVFSVGDSERYQAFDEVPKHLSGRNFRLVAVFKDAHTVETNSSVGISFCAEVTQLAKGRLVPLESDFPAKVLFQRVPYLDVLTGTSNTPTCYFHAHRNPDVLTHLGHAVASDKSLDLSTPDYLKAEAVFRDDGTRVGIPATLRGDGRPRNYIAQFISSMNYSHPIKCQATASYHEPTGGKGYILPVEHFERIAFDVYRSLGDPRPIYNFNQLVLKVSPGVRYFSVTLTIFYTLL